MHRSVVAITILVTLCVVCAPSHAANANSDLQPLSDKDQALWTDLKQWATARGWKGDALDLRMHKRHGFTFVATQPIATGTKFALVPDKMFITSFRVLSMNPLLQEMLAGMPVRGGKLSATDTVALWLFLEAANPQSEFAPWIKMLKADKRLQVDTWTVQEMELVDSLYTLDDSGASMVGRHQQQEEAYNVWFKQNKAVQSKLDQFDFDGAHSLSAFRWAFNVADARAFARDVGVGANNQETVLIPVMDLLFHDFAPQPNAWTLDKDAEYTAAHPMAAGDEVTVNLGVSAHGELLRRFNLAMPNFDDDTYHLVLPGVSPKLRLYREKAEILARLGFPTDRVYFRMNRVRFSTRLVQFLRIMHMNKADYAKFMSEGQVGKAHKKVLSPANERKVLRSIFNLANHQLQAQNSSIQLDLDYIMSPEVTENQRKVLTIRAESKKTLLLNKLNAKFRLAKELFADTYPLNTQGMDKWYTPWGPDDPKGTPNPNVGAVPPVSKPQQEKEQAQAHTQEQGKPAHDKDEL